MIRQDINDGSVIITSDKNINKVVKYSHKSFKNINLWVMHKYEGKKEQSGLFHLAEHLLFEDVKIGDKIYNSAELLAYASANGIDLNACTGSTFIGVSANIITPKIPPKLQWSKKYLTAPNIKVACDILNAMHDNCRKISKVAFEKEKDIVKAEINQYGDIETKHDIVETYMLGSEFGYSVIGSSDVIDTCKKTDLDNLVNHIINGSLLDCIYIECDEARHSKAVDYILDNLDIKVTRKKFKKPIKKSHRVISKIHHGPTSLAPIEIVGDVVEGKTPFLTVETGCVFTKNMNMNDVIIKYHMLRMLDGYISNITRVGSLAHHLREVHKLTYGMNIVKGKNGEDVNIHNGISASYSIDRFCLINGIEPRDVVSKLDSIIKDVHSNILKRITEEEFEDIKRDIITMMINDYRRPMQHTIDIVDKGMLPFVSMSRVYDISKIDFSMFKSFIKQNINKTKYTVIFV